MLATDTRSAVHTTPRAGARELALVGAVVGLVAGQVEIAFGPDHPSWVGDKYDTIGLGAATIGLATVALVAAGLLGTGPAAPPVRRMALAFGLLLPGVVGFTTAGRLWWIPGSCLCASSIWLAWDLRSSRRRIARVMAQRWATVLLVVLGVVSFALGATSVGSGGLLACAGGGAVVALAITRRGAGRAVAAAVAAATLGVHAALTWWTIVTPLILVVTLGVAVLAVDERRRALATCASRGGG